MISLLIAAALLTDTVPPAKATPKPAAAQDARPAKSVLHGVAVTLECTALANGRVENCQVLGETHPGSGFGEAAIALMQGVQVAPGDRDIQFARTIQFMP